MRVFYVICMRMARQRCATLQTVMAALCDHSRLRRAARARLFLVCFLPVCCLDAVSLDEAPTYEQAAAFLATQGYPTGQYTLLLTWCERTDGDERAMVTGYRVARAGGGDPRAFDLYAKDGRLLSPEERHALGIRAKTWTPRAISAPAEPGAAVALSAPQPRTPWSVRYSIGFAQAALLPPLDPGAFLEEDARADASGGKGVVRTGVFREVIPPLETGIGTGAGPWQALPDGSRVWNVLVQSPKAIGLRIEISAATLPAGCEVFAYNMGDARECYGPFTAADAAGGTFWTPTCFSADVALECRAPASVAPESLALRVARVAHLYRDPIALLETRAFAGACNLDVTCYPAWAGTARGVGGLGTIGLTGSLWCTGSLIVDLDPCTQTPYLLTANHCIPTVQRADSLEVYWLYQTDGCNGVAPPPATVPRTTGGADRLAFMGGRGDTGGGNDFCLLRLRNDPPPGLTFLGWATSVPPLATPVACIHHPRGDFKRICFGGLTNTDNPHSTWFHEVTWNAGTTEPGSSGSPLMTSATQQIIGQLWGGGASCSTPTDPDYYGRFDITYVIIKDYLNSVAQAGFAETALSAAENAGVFPAGVSLSKPAGAAGAAVSYAVAAGSATPGEDFIEASGLLHFGPGEDAANIELVILEDTSLEPAETVILTLSDPQCAELDPAASSVVVTIQDNDVDTDGDGLSDAAETSGAYGYVTDPGAADTDGDGLSDYDEVFGTQGHESNPTSRDSDGDGIDDFTEIIMGLDPGDPDDADALSSLRVPWFGANYSR